MSKYSFKVHVIVEYEGKHYREMREYVPQIGVSYNGFMEKTPPGGCNHIDNISGVVENMGKKIRERIKERTGR